MELAAIARVLWQRRLLVALGVIAAVAVGTFAGREGTGSTVSGVATVGVMLDTTHSQLVNTAPDGAQDLPVRAALLADALASDAARSVVAEHAALPVDQLVVRGPSALGDLPVVTPLVRDVRATAPALEAPHVVNLLAEEGTPLIIVEAHAPDAGAAQRLASATVAGLRSLVLAADSTRSRAFVLEAMTPIRGYELVDTSLSPRVLMVGAALATFALWCGGLVVAVGVARGLRPR